MINKSFTIQLAGRRIRISALHESVRALCEDYIVPDAEAFDFDVQTTQSDIDFERVKSAQEDEIEGIPHREFDDSYLETLAVYRKIATGLIDYDTLLMHGSVIEVGGSAVMFTGPSGTGKSTHAKLWADHIPSTNYINDDKPLVSVERGNTIDSHLGESSTEPRAYVHGTPWDGKHRRSNNASAPIKAICVLHQADTNSIREMSSAEAYPVLLQQTYRPQESALLIKTIRLLDGLIKTGVKFYELHCNMEAQAAELAYREIFKD